MFKRLGPVAAPFAAKLFAAALLFIPTSGSPAEAGGIGLAGVRCFDQTGCDLGCRCPACGYQCRLNADRGEETISGFDVESDVICIPRVVFPWQRAAAHSACSSCDGCRGRGCRRCVHNGARLRRVCRLKPDSYECPKCEYEWEAVNLCEEMRAAAEKAVSEADDAADGDSAGSPEALSAPEPMPELLDPPTRDLPLPPAGLDEALKFPTPIRPSRDQ